VASASDGWRTLIDDGDDFHVVCKMVPVSDDQYSDRFVQLFDVNAQKIISDQDAKPGCWGEHRT
jgi:hypothetical protein